jgi:GNAT superfamily N-acetyltransferase
MADVTIRKAAAGDVPTAAGTLADAFADDPAFSWAAPDAARRHKHAPRYFERLIDKIYLPKDEVHLADDGAGVALWAPPERWKISTAASLPLFPIMLRATGSKLPRAMKMLALMDSLHDQQDEPHYYLPIIGVRSSSRGKGYGGALLQHMLDRCDDEGRPAYLEATAPANQALYHRHGFVPLSEQRWPGGGPPFWPMWRSPR